VPLFGWSGLVVGEAGADDVLPGSQFRPPDRLLPLLAGLRRILQHLPHRHPRQLKVPCHFPLARPSKRTERRTREYSSIVYMPVASHGKVYGVSRAPRFGAPCRSALRIGIPNRQFVSAGVDIATSSSTGRA
jgi:hypothetical protein